MSERPWYRCSAIAEYQGFSAFLEMYGESMRFVINAKIEHSSQIPKLRKYIDCIELILKLPFPGRREDEIDEDWAE